MESNFTMLVARKDGLIKRTTCILGFFDDEILIKEVSNEEYKKLVDDNKEGKGFFKGIAASMTALNDYAKKLDDFSYDEFKDISTGIISRGDIKKIKYRKANTSYDPDMGTSNTEGVLNIKTNDKVVKFSHRYDNSPREWLDYFKTF